MPKNQNRTNRSIDRLVLEFRCAAFVKYFPKNEKYEEKNEKDNSTRHMSNEHGQLSTGSWGNRLPSNLATFLDIFLFKVSLCLISSHMRPMNLITIIIIIIIRVIGAGGQMYQQIYIYMLIVVAFLLSSNRYQVGMCCARVHTFAHSRLAIPNSTTFR